MKYGQGILNSGTLVLVLPWLRLQTTSAISRSLPGIGTEDQFLVAI